ncbi:serine hydrolase domain-containing protein [Natronospora cellulosivora (SeqCode)]
MKKKTKRKNKSLFIIIFLSFMIHFPFNSSVVYADFVDYSEVIEETEQMIQDILIEKNILGLSATVVNQDEIIWAKGFGYADLENEIKASHKTIYCIASVTKPITATAIMILVDQGLVELDEHIINYIPQLSLKGQDYKDIKVKHLLSHSAGLKYKVSYEYLFSDTTCLLEYLKYETLLFPPGKGYNYSNIGYSLLGLIIESTSGLSFEKYINKNIFEPLAMKNSYIGMDEIIDEITAGYFTYPGLSLLESMEKFGERYASYGLNYEDYFIIRGEGCIIKFPELDIPGGGIFSSVEDISHFLRFILSEGKTPDGVQLLSKNNINEMFLNQSSRYGLGWMLNNNNIIGHGGYFPPNNSSVKFSSEHNLGVVVMINTDNESMYQTIQSISDTILYSFIRPHLYEIEELIFEFLSLLESSNYEKAEEIFLSSVSFPLWYRNIKNRLKENSKESSIIIADIILKEIIQSSTFRYQVHLNIDEEDFVYIINVYGDGDNYAFY